VTGSSAPGSGPGADGTLDRVIDPVVPVAWLSDHRDEVIVADVRWYLDGRSGRAAYDGGHLPGAVFVELEEVLSGPSDETTGRHPLPSPENFAAELSGLGIGDDATVIAYDDEGGVIAARLVWMLRAIGRNAAILDGGIRAWDGPLETAPNVLPTASATPVPWPADLLAAVDELAGSDAVLLDARNGDRYRGENEPVDPRAGHVPGAVSVPCRENLDADGRLLPRSELRRRFEAAGVTAGRPVISYCGSGVTACHNLLVLEHAGLGAGRLFPGSWSQWSRDPSRPVATGDE
jgi:thiosulfate/3-mercaptopyruvate sulfurtransferase